jgi:hypothetical protein
MNKISCAKTIAALLLLVSLFVPLITLRVDVSAEIRARCAQDPLCKIPVAYAAENIVYFTEEIVSGKNEILIYKELFLYFAVFILPLLSLALKALPQSIIILLGSIPSAYTLRYFIGNHMVGSNDPLLGTWLALASWVILLSISLLTVWQHLPHNKSLKDAP